MSKQDLYEKQYGKKATAMTPAAAGTEERKKAAKDVDADVDFSKLNSMDEK